MPKASSLPASTLPPSDPEQPLAGEQRRRRWIVLLLTGLIVLALAGTLYAQHRRTVHLERAVTVRETAAVIGAVEAGIRVHVRQSAQYIEYRMQEYLEQLVQTSAARAIVLTTLHGEQFMTAGEAGLLADPSRWAAVDLHTGWTTYQNCALFHRRLDSLEDTPGMGPGRSRRDPGQWVNLPSGPYKIAVAMDVSDLTARLAAGRLRLGAALTTLTLVGLLAVLAFTLWERRQTLQAHLSQAHAQVAQMERLAQLGAGLAHETRNPLSVVRGLLQSTAAAEGVEDATRRTIAAAIDEVDRTVGRINSFLQLARPVEPRIESVALSPMLHEVTQLLRTEAPPGTTIECIGDDTDRLVLADADMLRRALFNLGLNALRAVEGGGQVQFTVERQASDRLAIHVVDDGIGIAAEDLPRVTEPYFSRSEHGSGLGLAIVDRLCAAHGWQLRILSHPDQGTRVSLLGLNLG